LESFTNSITRQNVHFFAYIVDKNGFNFDFPEAGSRKEANKRYKFESTGLGPCFQNLN
jgi:hypothetical protein